MLGSQPIFRSPHRNSMDTTADSLATFIAALVATAPPLTSEQLDLLAVQLSPTPD